MKPNTYTNQEMKCSLCKHSQWHRLEIHACEFYFCLYGEENFKEFVKKSDDFEKDWDEYAIYIEDREVCAYGHCDKFERKN